MACHLVESPLAFVPVIVAGLLMTGLSFTLRTVKFIVVELIINPSLAFIVTTWKPTSESVAVKINFSSSKINIK